MDANNGTSWSSKGNYEPTVKGLYYHYNIPNEYASQELATKHSPIIVGHWMVIQFMAHMVLQTQTAQVLLQK